MREFGEEAAGVGGGVEEVDQLTSAKGPIVGRHCKSIGDEVVRHWCSCLGLASQRFGEMEAQG